MNNNFLRDEIIISNVVTEDLPAIVALARKATERNVFPTLSKAGQEAIRQSQASDTSSIVDQDIYQALKVKVADKLVAYAAWRNGFYLAQLFVDPDYQGKGIGTLLLDEVVKRSSQPRLEVRSSLNAVGFYRKYGFVVRGEVSEINNIKFLPMEFYIS